MMQVDRVGRIVDGDDHDGRYRSERRGTASVRRVHRAKELSRRDEWPQAETLIH